LLIDVLKIYLYIITRVHRPLNVGLNERSIGLVWKMIEPKASKRREVEPEEPSRVDRAVDQGKAKTSSLNEIIFAARITFRVENGGNRLRRKTGIRFNGPCSVK
jgi:hypothetical protein